MSDYLKNLVERTLNPSRVVQPRLASRFEPHADGAHSAFTAFDLEAAEEEAPIASPTVEARAQARHDDATAPPERPTLTHAGHTPPPVFERRPGARPYEQPHAPTDERASAPPTSQTLPTKETTAPAATVEASKHSALEETPTRVSDAARDPRPSAESGTTQTPRVSPRVVEPRLHPAPRVPEAQSPIASAADAGRDEAGPTIRVTIGRVDVRAVAAPAREARRAPEPPRPALTLEDYLRRRGGGSG